MMLTPHFLSHLVMPSLLLSTWSMPVFCHLDTFKSRKVPTFLRFQSTNLTKTGALQIELTALFRLMRLFRPFMAVVCGGILAYGGWFFWNMHWPVQRVVVEGQLMHVSQEQIEQALAYQLAGGFFSCKINALKDIVDELPWVKSVRAKRSGLHTVEFFITEHREFARWYLGGVIDEEGDLFYPAEELKYLPFIEGGGEYNLPVFFHVLLEIKELNEPLQPVEFVRVFSDSFGSWSIDLKNGSRVLLGRFNVLNRLRRFWPFYGQNKALFENIAVFDMRYSHGVSVTVRAKENKNA